MSLLRWLNKQKCSISLCISIMLLLQASYMHQIEKFATTTMTLGPTSVMTTNRPSQNYLGRNLTIEVPNLLQFRVGQKNRREIPFVIVACHKEPKHHLRFSKNMSSLENATVYRNTKVLLKSMAMATRTFIRIILLSDKRSTLEVIREYVNQWPSTYRRKLLLEYQTFKPIPECRKLKLVKKCVSARLYFHKILLEEDAVIHIDSDFIMLQSPEELLKHFANFNSQQFIGATPNTNYYENPGNADYFYYGQSGINAGILLMNLTRIRHLPYDWIKAVGGVCRSYNRRLKLYDQGILNIMFSEYPESLYELDCRWNYSFYYCYNYVICDSAIKTGKIFAVHGISGSFGLRRIKKIKVLYEAFERFQLGDPITNLVSKMEEDFREIEILQPEDSDGCKNITGLDEALLQYLVHRPIDKFEIK